jgi:hypothetical protein
LIRAGFRRTQLRPQRLDPVGGGDQQLRGLMPSGIAQIRCGFALLRGKIAGFVRARGHHRISARLEAISSASTARRNILPS